jgi:hypothetical protein
MAEAGRDASVVPFHAPDHRGAAERRRPYNKPGGKKMTHPVILKLADNIGAARGTDYFPMKEQLTKDEQDLLHSVRKFEVLPIVNSYWERGEF